jgi:leucyl/phenylalanyl-tRNA--protein transferase
MAHEDPNGLLAVGGDLSVSRLLLAYRNGIFPWYEMGQPILWWAPDPRSVLFPDALKISRSLKKSLLNKGYSISMDTDFAGVIRACSGARHYTEQTWITAEMTTAYTRLNEMGIAHSVETWLDGRLVGGLYGIALGRLFFGESMFSRATDASKVALVHLVGQLKAWDYQFIDCQIQSDHMDSLGARCIPRYDFQQLLQEYVEDDCLIEPWHLEWQY